MFDILCFIILRSRLLSNMQILISRMFVLFVLDFSLLSVTSHFVREFFLSFLVHFVSLLLFSLAKTFINYIHLLKLGQLWHSSSDSWYLSGSNFNVLLKVWSVVFTFFTVKACFNFISICSLALVMSCVKFKFASSDCWIHWF